MNPTTPRAPPVGARLRDMHRAGLHALALVALMACSARADDSVITPLPPVEQPVQQPAEQNESPPAPTIFDRIRLAALGDPQDLTEPLMPDDLAPPGQPRQEFEPPAGRKRR